MKVLLVFGGRSGEHEVSVSSARAVAEALDELGHEIVGVGITMEGRWVRADPRADDRVEDGDAFALPLDAGSASQIAEAAFPVLHGPHGEDGSIQGLFEMADLPYVGAGVEGSAIGSNKWLQKRLFIQAGLPVVPFHVLTRAAWEDQPEHWATTLVDRVGYPCFAKPARLGSSIGISKVHDEVELFGALERAFRHDDLVLLEAQGHGREIEIGVVDEPVEVSQAGEVAPDGEFYDYRAKYLGEWTELRIPADVPDQVAGAIDDHARLAFEVSRCEGFARVDFFYDPATEALQVNEINTVPGMTPQSMFPRVWDASGMPFSAVVQRLLDHALARHERKRALEASRAAAHDAEIAG